MSVLIEHFTPPRQPLMAGRREAGVMADAPADCNRQRPAIDRRPNA